MLGVSQPRKHLALGSSVGRAGPLQLSVSPFQLLDVDPNDQEEDGANIDLDSQRKGKCAVIKTSTRQVRLLSNRKAEWGEGWMRERTREPCRGQ